MKTNLKTLALMPWPRFAHIYAKHDANAYLKSTFREVWEKEEEILDATSCHRFRTRRDVNQWLMREWQICKGNFVPASPKREKPYYVKNDNSDIAGALRGHKHRVICINDNGAEEIRDFGKAASELQKVMYEVFPEKSSFEK